jgi:hypothetical protein
MLSPLIPIFKFFGQFTFYLSQLEKNPNNQKIKNLVSNHLKDLNLIKKLFFEFNENPDYNSLKVIDNGFIEIFFEQNKEKRADFFRFCAKPYKEIFDEYIKIYELLNQGNLIEARENLNKFMEKHSISFNNIGLYFTDESLFKVLGEIKADQYKKLIKG